MMMSETATWYLHVRALNAQGQWGPTAHRKVRVDAHAPQVSLTLDPPNPTGNGGWFVTPVNVAVNAADAAGSGVKSVEFSVDGVTWQPYVLPLHLATDTPGTNVYARATDGVGNVSQPVSIAIKIDRTPPNSHVAGGAGPGALVAKVTTNGAGNQAVVLAGAISDNLSGRAGMIQEEGTYWGVDPEIGSWHPLPDPAIEVNWYYTATHELGAGYHIFTARARDEAGNQETAYEIARLVVPPQASPDLRGSSVAASQQTARPGDEILLTLVGRNAGFQEAHVAMSTLCPSGWNPSSRPLPGRDLRRRHPHADLAARAGLARPVGATHSSCRGGSDLGATVLENRATFHAFWPNTDLLPEAEQKQFLDREQTVVATERVSWSIPSCRPAPTSSRPGSSSWPAVRDMVTGPEVVLSITAAPDAQRMYVREWAPDPVDRRLEGGAEQRLDRLQPHLHLEALGRPGGQVRGRLGGGRGGQRLDAGGGRDDLCQPGRREPGPGRWAADPVSSAPGRGERVWASLKTVSGDPDLYAWGPRNAFWPDRSANATLRPGR